MITGEFTEKHPVFDTQLTNPFILFISLHVKEAVLAHCPTMGAFFSWILLRCDLWLICYLVLAAFRHFLYFSSLVFTFNTSPLETLVASGSDHRASPLLTRSSPSQKHDTCARHVLRFIKGAIQTRFSDSFDTIACQRTESILIVHWTFVTVKLL